jgi:uncharacterized RDD family membrane protein YckC
MRIAGISVVGFLCLLLGGATLALAVPRDLLAQGDADRFWIAGVGPSSDTADSFDQTTLVFRQFGEESNWQDIDPIPARAVGLAGFNDQLVVVLDSGKWWLVDSDEQKQGAAVPDLGRLIAAANDRDILWGLVVSQYTAPATMTGGDLHLGAPRATSAPMAAATQLAGPATQGSIGNLAATQSAVGATQPALVPTPERLIAYRFKDGNWVNPVQLPASVPRVPEKISLAVEDQLPVVAWQKLDGSIDVSRLSSDGTWEKPIEVAATGDVGDFKLLNLQGRVALWVAAPKSASQSQHPAEIAATNPANLTATTLAAATQSVATASAGRLFTGDDLSQVKDLRFTGLASTPDGAQTVTIALGRIRWIAIADKKRFEQAFDFSGNPIQAVSSVSQVPAEVISIPDAIVAAIGIVGAAGVAGYLRRGRSLIDPNKDKDSTAEEFSRSRGTSSGKTSAANSSEKDSSASAVAEADPATDKKSSTAKPFDTRKFSTSGQFPPADDSPEKLELAPLGVRFAAGLVDLFPIWLTIFFLQPLAAKNALGDNLTIEKLVALAMLASLFHPMISEMLCGQSLGKMVFGLRVVGSDGNAASLQGLFVRNLLRLFDVALIAPLLLIIASPLRQRLGDMAGSTVVIARDLPPESEKEE